MNNLKSPPAPAAAMSDYEAVGVAEGFEPSRDIEHERAAWQRLIDTGLAWRLQGWFGRTAMRLIETSQCQPPKRAAQPSLIPVDEFMRLGASARTGLFGDGSHPQPARWKKNED